MKKSQVIWWLVFILVPDDTCQGSAFQSLPALVLHPHQLDDQGLLLLKGAKREGWKEGLWAKIWSPTVSSCQDDFWAGASRGKAACTYCSLWVSGVEATCWKYYVTGFFFVFQTFALFQGYGGFLTWGDLTRFWDFLLLPTSKYPCDFIRDKHQKFTSSL